MARPTSPRPLPAVVVAVLLAALPDAPGAARAQQEPPTTRKDAAAPDGETAGHSPRQDPEALAAMRRVAELVPSPFAGGGRVLQCTATLLRDIPFAVRGRFHWESGEHPEIRVDLPSPLLQTGYEDRQRAQIRNVVLLPFVARAMWDPAAWTSADLTTGRSDTDLVVTMTESRSTARGELTIAKTGLPAYIRLVPGEPSRGQGSRVMKFAFEERGGTHALSGVELPGAVAVAVVPYGHPEGRGLPRRIDRRLADGKIEAFLLHEYRVDGEVLEGTSRAEATAGRLRRVDPEARSALSRWDDAIAVEGAERLRAVSCRLEYAMPTGVLHFRVEWSSGVLDRCEPEPGADGRPETDAGAWGAAAVVGEGVAEQLLPPSRQLSGYDASFDGGKDPRIVLDAFTEETPVRRLRIRAAASGLPAEAVQEYGDGGTASTLRWQWAPLRGKHVVASEALERGDFRSVTRTAWFDVPGFPPLRRSVERTLTGGTGPGLYVQRFTDWVIDGRPVPGTESAPPAAPATGVPPPPDAPK